MWMDLFVRSRIALWQVNILAKVLFHAQDAHIKILVQANSLVSVVKRGVKFRKKKLPDK